MCTNVVGSCGNENINNASGTFTLVDNNNNGIIDCLESFCDETDPDDPDCSCGEVDTGSNYYLSNCDGSCDETNPDDNDCSCETVST